MLTSKSSCLTFCAVTWSIFNVGWKVRWVSESKFRGLSDGYDEFLCTCSRSRQNGEKKVGPVIWDTLYIGHRYVYFSFIETVLMRDWNAYLFGICIYRVAGLSWYEAGGCKSGIMRGFPDVLGLFGPQMVGEISFRDSWTTGMKKKFRYLILKKG